MIRTFTMLSLWAMSLWLTACISLNYDGPTDDGGAPRIAANAAQMHDPPQPSADSTTQAFMGDEAPRETELGWHELTSMARNHQQRGEFEEADRRLEQAALLVAHLPPTDVRRRVVFGNRARFAEQLAFGGETVRADALADELLLEAEIEPELGGASVVSLAVSVAKRRGQIAATPSETGDENAEEDIYADHPLGSRLALYRIALRAAQSGTVDRQRLLIASTVAQDAYFQKMPRVARNAVEQALKDLHVLSPEDVSRRAGLLLLRARIAIVSGDLDLAITDATRFNQILEENEADANRRGIGEATLAEALAKSGDLDRALAIGRGARARLDGEQELDPYAQRTILGAMARIEFQLTHADRARRYFDEALAIEVLDSDADRYLFAELAREREELGSMNPPPEG